MLKTWISLLCACGCVAYGYGQSTVSGRAYDDQGQPLVGVTIALLNATVGAVTTQDGRYEINNVPEGTQTFVARYLGYATKSLTLKVANGDNILDFVLVPAVYELEQLVVGANKQQQNVQKTPVTMASIGAKAVESLQINEVSELNRLTANFKSYDDGGGSFTMFATRGIYTIDQVPTIGFYIDGVPVFNTFGFPSILSDVESIEMLKGPQGTLYGRNALGGVVNITTRAPSNTVNGYVETGIGNLGQRQGAVGFGAALIQEKLYMRASGAYTNRDGYITNIGSGNRDLYARETASGNLRLDYYPSSKLSFLLNTSIEDRKVNAYALLGGFNVGSQVLDSLKNNNPFTVDFDREGVYKTLISNTALKIGYEGAHYSLTAVSSYQYTRLQRRNDDFDFTPFDINYLDRSLSKQQNFAEEIRLQSKGTTRLQWVAGLFLYRAKESVENPIVNGEDAGHSVGVYTQQTNTTAVQTGGAAFGQLSYQLLPQLNLFGGLRYEIESSDLSLEEFNTQEGVRFEAPDGFVGSPENPSPRPLMDRSFEGDATFEAVSPKMGISFQPSQKTFLFANVARGYRPGGLNEFALTQEGLEYKPETSWNFELGAKMSWRDNTLRTNLTAFYIEWRDQQLFTIIDVSRFLFGNDNIGRSVSQGLELEAAWLPISHLKLSANVGYLHTEIKEYEVVGFAGDVNNAGNQQGYSPQWNGNIAAGYDWQLTGNMALFVNLTAIYQSDMYFDPENTLEQTAYVLTNGQVGVKSGDKSLAVWAKNLTDETYFGYGYGIGGTSTFASYGLPRTYGVTFKAKF